MHLLVNELCEYQNAKCNNKKSLFDIFRPEYIVFTFLFLKVRRFSVTLHCYYCVVAFVFLILMLVFVLGGLLGTGYKICDNKSHNLRGMYGGT